MSQIYNFIKECGTFFVLTLNDDFPAGRPFGAIMEYNNSLYISTSDTKSVYKQLAEHNKVQIVALKNGTRDWVRVSSIATECVDPTIKQRMLEECPVLAKHFSSEGVISFVSLRFYFPLISSIGYCQNPQYLQGFVGSAHTRPPE